MRAFKRARFLQPHDVINIVDNGKTLRATVFSARRSEDKTWKAQHMGTGNVARGIHVMFMDGEEALLHPDEQIEVLS